MSTWGAGLFSSDGAQDFLEELAEISQTERLAELERTFREVLADPAALMKTVFPESVIAGAALVAVGLPGGQWIVDGEGDFIAEAIHAAALDESPLSLASVAASALSFVTAPDSIWREGWVSAADRDEAIAAVAGVTEVLRAAA